MQGCFFGTGFPARRNWRWFEMLSAGIRIRVRQTGGRPVIIVSMRPAEDNVLEFRVCCMLFFRTVTPASNRSPAYLVRRKRNK